MICSLVKAAYGDESPPVVDSLPAEGDRQQKHGTSEKQHPTSDLKTILHYNRSRLSAVVTDS